MIDIREILLQWFIIILIKRFLLVILKKGLAEELHKPIIRKFSKRMVHSPFIDNIWGADLTDMQLISKLNKGICFLLCVIETFSKYAWVIALKDKKSIGITNTFQKILKESNNKSNKVWVDKGNEFYNRSMKSFLKNNNEEIMKIMIMNR